MINLNRPETQFAIHVVRQASQLVRMVQSDLVSPALTKDDRSPVTVADFASQALIGKELLNNFPNDPLVGEEVARVLHQPESQTTLEGITKFVSNFAPDASPELVCSWIDRGAGEPSKRFWTLDPIDGTKGFLRGDQYAVALALIVAGQVQIGVLGCPNLMGDYLQGNDGDGIIAVAVRGEGAWLGSIDGDLGKLFKCHVSDIADSTQARLLRSFESGHTNISQIDYFAQEMGVETEPVRMDSQAKYVLLALGKGELYLRLLSPRQPDYREKIWDQAAGSLIVEEAGGQVSDLDGATLDFTAGRSLINNRGILATNCILHQEAIQALRAIDA
jgi:3'(2'), 5'-bisphosphate nucleotidase